SYEKRTAYGAAGWSPVPKPNEYMVISRWGNGWWYDFKVLVLEADVKALNEFGDNWQQVARELRPGESPSSAFYPPSLNYVGETVLQPSIDFLQQTRDTLAAGNKNTRGHESGFKGKAAEAFLNVSEGLERSVRETADWLTVPQSYATRIAGDTDGNTQYERAARDFVTATTRAVSDWQGDELSIPMQAMKT